MLLKKVVIAITDILHQLSKTHGLINARHRADDFGEEVLGALVGLETLQRGQLQLIGVDGGINLHGEEVLDAMNGCGLLGELLIKAITEVVCWVGRYE